MIGTELLAQNAPWNDEVQLLIIQRGPTTDQRFIGNVVMQKQEAGAYAVEPSIRLSRTAAQQLMDNLWQCGLRPSEGSGSAGALKATEKHLEDMRKLVFEVRGSSSTTGASR
jgi:hypothetical protein